MPNLPPTFQDIKSLFDEAEGALKVAEHSQVMFVVPAQNELRYAGRHVVEAVCAGESDRDKQERELRKALKHCKRALYDVFEAELLYVLESYQQFRDDYRDIQIAASIPDYASIRISLVKGLDEYRQIAPVKRDEREMFTEQVSRIRRELFPLLEKLEVGREELNKVKQDYRKAEQDRAENKSNAIRNRRQAALFFLIGTILTLVGLGVTIYFNIV